MEKSPLEEATLEVSRNASRGGTRVAGDRMGAGVVYSKRRSPVPMGLLPGHGRTRGGEGE